MAKKLSKRVKKQIINIAFLVLLIGVTVIVLFTSQDIDVRDIWNFAVGCNPWYIVAAFGGMLGYIVFEAISLHVIMRRLGRKPKVTSSIAYTTSDLYYSAITPSASGGQPASAFYMMRDGVSGGTAGFTVLFNIIAYTGATIVIGLFAVCACPNMFGYIGNWFAKTLIIFGFVAQLLLLALLLLCLFRARIIMRIGGWGISLFTKMRIVKKPEKWRAKLDNVVTKYRACRGVIKKHPILFLYALLLNTAQRASQTLVPCFVIMAAAPSHIGGQEFLALFCMQAYVMIGYNSIPLPGGTGAYEYLYPNVFGTGTMYGIPLDMTFVFSAMMVSRAISYYCSMIICGLYTLVYHAVGIKRGKPDDEMMPTDIDLAEAVRQGLREGDVVGAELAEDISADTAVPMPQNAAAKTDDSAENIEADDNVENTDNIEADDNVETDENNGLASDDHIPPNSEIQENEDGQ